jgi:hypothetical protein
MFSPFLDPPGFRKPGGSCCVYPAKNCFTPYLFRSFVRRNLLQILLNFLHLRSFALAGVSSAGNT